MAPGGNLDPTKRDDCHYEKGCVWKVMLVALGRLKLPRKSQPALPEIVTTVPAPKGLRRSFAHPRYLSLSLPA